MTLVSLLCGADLELSCEKGGVRAPSTTSDSATSVSKASRDQAMALRDRFRSIAGRKSGLNRTVDRRINDMLRS